MKKTLCIIMLVCITCTKALAQDQEVKDICVRFNDLNTAIRDLKIKKHNAAPQVQKLIAQLRGCTLQIKDDAAWIFPLQGYTSSAIGGSHGNGYTDKGYSYFDGNKHLAHPAHDIFISDRDQDGIDDKTHAPVNIMAVADGVVIACCNEWAQSSPLRGGRYIWIYHPRQNILTYYAHNRAIFVSPGDIVKKGDKIAEMGRTGYNAFKKRSPTHLHFSSYHLVNDLPVAYNGYAQLVKAQHK